MSEPATYFDVIICGAGPAGSTCALALADSGLRVALIDKADFPRDKVCGDAVAAYARKVLHTIHPRFALAFDNFSSGYRVNTYRVFGPNGAHIDVTSPEYGLIARRYDWDHFLFRLASEQSHVTCLLNHSVRDVSLDLEKGEVRINTNQGGFVSKMIVGCDGAHSIVGKKLAGTSRDLNHHSGAVRAYYRNVAGLAEQTFELHFLDQILPGYFWIFPLRDGMANVGMGALSSHVSKKKIKLRELLRSTIEHHPFIRNRFAHAEMMGEVEGFGLPLGSRKVKMSGDHFMLCGDAASLIDPVTGEGIGPAMVSGRYAGWHVKNCFDAKNFSADFMGAYDRQVYGKFWRKHQRSYFVQRQIVTRPKLINGLIGVASKSHMARTALARLLT